MKRYPLEQNQGLGLALRQGVLQCQYDIIARMDTDDIAVPDRFEKQVQLMEKDKLDLLGGHIAEFIDNPDAVSYTHLDVYKRQVLVRPGSSSKSVCHCHYQVLQPSRS